VATFSSWADLYAHKDTLLADFYFLVALLGSTARSVTVRVGSEDRAAHPARRRADRSPRSTGVRLFPVAGQQTPRTRYLSLAFRAPDSLRLRAVPVASNLEHWSGTTSAATTRVQIPIASAHGFTEVLIRTPDSSTISQPARLGRARQGGISIAQIAVADEVGGKCRPARPASQEPDLDLRSSKSSRTSVAFSPTTTQRTGPPSHRRSTAPGNLRLRSRPLADPRPRGAGPLAVLPLRVGGDDGI
jgi:hypothetical protein